MYLNKKSYVEKLGALQSDYWRKSAGNRWEYMSTVIHMLEDLGITNTIEAGTNGISLSDTSVLFNLPKYNLDITPYPFKDKEFDCFIALQVWEHIHNQAAAFEEVKRISNMAILSFPYKWSGSSACHNNIDRDVIRKWTSNYPESNSVIIGTTHSRRRIINTYLF